MLAAMSLRPGPTDCEIAPLERAHALHAGFYGADWLAFEQREIFAGSWQLAGPASDVAAPGDHAVVDIAGRSVLIAHGEDGTLRAFHNFCRHRAAPIAECAGKGAKRFRCPYHGWTYELDGRLRAAPEMQGAADFDPSQYGLTQVRLMRWQGLLFVALSPDAPAFEAAYGGVAERIAPIDISAMRLERRETWRVAANWKVYVDNYLEGYHVPTIHPALNEIVDYKGYVTELDAYRSLQTSNLAASDAYGDEGRVFYYFLWPNVMLNIVPGRMQTNRVLADGPERCVVEFDYYYAAPHGDEARVAADVAFSAKVQEEDRLICEAVQKNLSSGAYVAGRLCPKRESGLWHFHNLLRKSYAADFR